MNNIDTGGYPLQSAGKVYRSEKKSNIRTWLICFLLISLATMFLPWTQHITAKGRITTLRPDQRLQELNTIIPGRVVKWFVKEGDLVKTGDTILLLGEVKDDYLDPQLVQRTRQQIAAKKDAVGYYRGKASVTATQMDALSAGRSLKLGQLQNKMAQLRLKLQSDSADAAASRNEYQLARQQYERQQKMYEEGLVSLTQLEQRNQAMQNAAAKKIVSENKLSNTRQEQSILNIEMGAVQQEYIEKAAKAEGERFQSMSQAATGEGEISKLQNQETGYIIRKDMYYVIAPQNGQVMQVKKAGIGEILKEGEKIAQLVPERNGYAVEMFVRPADLPLINPGQKVSFVFDGFPAIVFSGWPQASSGTFSGRVTTIENAVSENGKFRVLVAEDETAKKWPPEVKMGTGARAIVLLKDVPVWYELWRNINGFPPDYYKTEVTSKQKK
jgi:multidrug efflux pump subunit AcrA (membrane-fusion protein)